ncbi:MAG: SDR family oxidoreductase [Solirubrobacterales bacterium]|jgi:NAD(P)-dependent dehydrogenase (short-subunit alcohol dehydrogenase family)
MARKQVKSVSGQVVAITGGAQGIGKSTAAALIRRGARVAIGDLNQELAEKTATELGGNCVAFELDVTSRPSFEAFLDAAEAELGPVDVVINNAGIMPLNMLSDEPDEIAKLQIDINLHGVIFGTKIAIARMVPRAKGHIVNIASQAGKAGFPGGATYCATKHAVVGLSEAARLELRDTGVEVSVVMPAVVNTELGSGLHEARGVKTLEPEEVAEAVVEAIETNRFDVWVPKNTAAIATVMNIVPRRGREAIARLLKADDILATPDKGARAAYENRAAGSQSDEAAAEAAESEEAAKKG